MLTVTSMPALVVPLRWFPKGMFMGATPAVGAVPVPFKVTDCGDGTALSATLRAAARAPVAPGVKVTLMTQVFPGPGDAAITAPLVQVVPETAAKSPELVPEKETAGVLRVTEALPEFVNVMVIEALVVLMR